MKTNRSRTWRLALSLTGTLALLGCFDETPQTQAQAPAEIVVSNSVNSTSAIALEEAPPLKAIIPPANLSAGLPDIIRLAQSGVGDEVLLAFIAKSDTSFAPSVDEIVYLKDLGISENVIAALVRSDSALVSTPSKVSSAEPASPPQTNLTQPAPLPADVPSAVQPAAPSYTVAADPAYTETAAAPVEQVNIAYFEETLAPYGSWVEVADYGRCWQPTVVLINRSWRPYADRGRWLYTSSGWYWQSDYSWGWAPFHYGRWHRDHRIGWVWVPGSTWGPAWVSWRYTDSYCGWAPLPPAARYNRFGFWYGSSRVGFSFDFGLRDDCYTFVPTSRFCDRTPYRYYVAPAHSRTIYRNSVVINNYINGNNNTIINEGIGRDRIARATRTSIRPVALRDLPTTTAAAGRGEKFDGASLAVYRPDVRSISRSGAVRDRSTVNAALDQNSPAPSGAASPSRTQPTRTQLASGAEQRNVPSPTPEVAASNPSAQNNDSGTTPGAFPRTWTPSTTIARQSRISANQAAVPQFETAAPASAASVQATPTVTPSGRSAIRDFQTAEVAGAPATRRLPSPIANYNRREIAPPPQANLAPTPSITPAPAVSGSGVAPPTVHQQSSVPQSLRSFQAAQPAPQTFQRAQSSERFTPRSVPAPRAVPERISPAPQAAPPVVAAPRPQPQRVQPQAQQPQPREQPSRSQFNARPQTSERSQGISRERSRN